MGVEREAGGYLGEWVGADLVQGFYFALGSTLTLVVGLKFALERVRRWGGVCRRFL